MAIPAGLLMTTCDIYRPFGDRSPTAANVQCRLVADFADGRARSSGGLNWTHYMDVDVVTDVQDGCSRSAGSSLLTYADGDEVRVPTGAATPRYTVVWVEKVNEGTPREFKRAYLIRDTA